MIPVHGMCQVEREHAGLLAALHRHGEGGHESTAAAIEIEARIADRVVIAFAEAEEELLWRERRQRGPRRQLKRLGTSGIQVGALDLAEVLARAYASFAASKRS